MWACVPVSVHVLRPTITGQDIAGAPGRCAVGPPMAFAIRVLSTGPKPHVDKTFETAITKACRSASLGQPVTGASPVPRCPQAIAEGEPPPPPPTPTPGVRGQKTVCLPKIGLKFPAPLINFSFCRRKPFLMWGGGGIGLGLARAPNNPPSPPRGPQAIAWLSPSARARARRRTRR